MSMTYSTRHAIHPSDSKTDDTRKHRKAFLTAGIFRQGSIMLAGTLRKGIMAGSAYPVSGLLKFAKMGPLSSENSLCSSRLVIDDIGIVYISCERLLPIEGETYTLANKKAPYINKVGKEESLQPTTTEAATRPYLYSVLAFQKSMVQTETLEMSAREISTNGLFPKS